MTKKVNAAGVYVISLFHEGKFRDVLIDDQLPCNEYRSLCFGKVSKDLTMTKINVGESVIIISKWCVN